MESGGSRTANAVHPVSFSTPCDSLLCGYLNSTAVTTRGLRLRNEKYLENVGTYNPTRNPAEIKLNLTRVNYWLEKGAQPTETVNRLIKASTKAANTAAAEAQA